MPETFDEGFALVIGIANYPNVTKLPGEVLNDARDVADLLMAEHYCAYPAANVRLLEDKQATAQDIRQGLKHLAQSAGPGDTTIFFFSGHGGRVESGPDRGTYLIPFDGDPGDLRGTAISGEELTELFSSIKAKRLVVLLDACHSAGAGELKLLSPLAGIAAKGGTEIKAGLDKSTYEALAQGAGRVIMASCRSDETSLILAGMRNSLFTYYLLEALKGEAPTSGDGVIRVFDVFRYVSDKVPAHPLPAHFPAQHPIFKAHEVEKDFPLSLYLGGKRVSITGLAAGTGAPAPAARPPGLSGRARLAITKRLVDRWHELATYFEIPHDDRARFAHGREPDCILDWLGQRNKLGELREAFNWLGYNDLIEELDHHPR